MYVDINSCFATVEQQANPFLRGKPVAVAAYTTDRGCILAASYEAKRYGVKTGMRVIEGKALCPSLRVIASDPDKYRAIHTRLVSVLKRYTPHIIEESIDEMALDFSHTPIVETYIYAGYSSILAMRSIAVRIKEDIRRVVGVWITVSIGIAPNIFLAKTASNLVKPDGLSFISSENALAVFATLSITDLCGISTGYATRLQKYGITSVLALYHASPLLLQQAFGSIVGHHWWQWMHGFASGSVFDAQPKQKNFSQSYAFGKIAGPCDRFTKQMLAQLTKKLMLRVRTDSSEARGCTIGCVWRNHGYWHKTFLGKTPFFATEDAYRTFIKLLESAPEEPIRILQIGVSHITKTLYQQQTLDMVEVKKRNVTQAVDGITNRFGTNAIFLGQIAGAERMILDRISFGKSGV